MAAKAALLAVLADSSLTEKDMVSSALTTARQYKLGVLPLRKLLDEMTNSQGKKPVETVEDAVMELVEHACGSSSIEKESSTKAAIADGDSKDHSTVHEPEVRDTRDSDHDHDPVDSASGLPKAKALAMAAIEQAQAQVQEQERTTADNDTVSTLTILTQLVQKLNEDRQESRNREARLQKTIGEMNSEIKKMTTLVAAQAGAAEDREARLKKKIHNLEYTVSQLSESITEIMTNQINAAKENNENHQKLARKLNDIKTPSNPRQGKPEMTRPTPEKTKNTNRETTDEKRNEGSFPDPPPSRNTTPVDTLQTGEYTPSATPQNSQAPAPRENQWLSAAKKGKSKTSTETTTPLPAKTSEAKQLRGTSHVPRAVFYLRGISPECTAGHIEKYCAEREIRVSNCRILQTRRFGTRAARLSVAQIDAEKAEMLSENFWPEHISIRPWIFPEDGEIVERFESGGRRLRASN